TRAHAAELSRRATHARAGVLSLDRHAAGRRRAEGLMRAVWALIVKDLRLLSRDRGALFLTFAWPLVLAIFFGALGPGFGAKLDDDDEPGAITVLAVDEDRSAASLALLAELDDDARIELEPVSLDDAR